MVVPTYRRPQHLRRCLVGLYRQSRAPKEIVVVHRRDDEEAHAVLSESTNKQLREVTVDGPGVLAAMRAGMRASTEGIIAFTDDDAVPRRDWIARLLFHFEEPLVGAVGGRDVIHPQAAFGSLVQDVGRITRWGKLIGNHHLGTGPPRDVMVLKGVNMAFRREALALPSRLRGVGMQLHFEVATSLWARRQGWRLVYDPAVVVDHYPGPRFDGDHRRSPESRAVRDTAYNLVYCLAEFGPGIYWRRAVYGLVVGDAAAPGLARAAMALLRGEGKVLQRLLPSLEGQSLAFWDIARGQRPITALGD